ncbi:hypothetical protein ACTXT7_015147 [Hymenolepis weldensis]
MSHQTYWSPPNSPNLTVGGCAGRRVVGEEVNKHPHNTKSSLMKAVTPEMEDMNKDHLMKACGLELSGTNHKLPTREPMRATEEEPTSEMPTCQEEQKSLPLSILSVLSVNSH